MLINTAKLKQIMGVKKTTLIASYRKLGMPSKIMGGRHYYDAEECLAWREKNVSSIPQDVMWEFNFGTGKNILKYTCPKCNSVRRMYEEWEHYCPNCGRRLSWSKNEIYIAIRKELKQNEEAKN